MCKTALIVMVYDLTVSVVSSFININDYVLYVLLV